MSSTTSHARPIGAPIPFEEIPPRLRPQAIEAYLCLLDEGYVPEHITFLDYDGFVRVEGSERDGTGRTSRPVDPDRLASEPTARKQPLTRQERAERRREREDDLRSLIGQRVRIGWPSGHERIGVVRERTLPSYRRPQIVLEDINALHALEDAAALDALDLGRFKAVETTSDWAAL